MGVFTFSRNKIPLTSSDGYCQTRRSPVCTQLIVNADNIAEKIAGQVGRGGNQGGPTVEEEERGLSSMELDHSDEGVSQPMEELNVDVESRRVKRSSPSTAAGFLGEQKKDEVTGEESCPENKKSRYSAEEEAFFINYSIKLI